LIYNPCELVTALAYKPSTYSLMSSVPHWSRNRSDHPVPNTTIASYFFGTYFHSSRPFPYSKFVAVFPVFSCPDPFCFRVPYLVTNSVEYTAGMFQEWDYLGILLLFILPFYYIYFSCTYSSSNRFDISLSPQIPYDALALCHHLDARSRLVPRRSCSRILLFLHRTCLRSPFRRQHLISYLALPPKPWGWFDPLAHIMSYGCPGSCLLNLFSLRSWKRHMRVIITPRMERFDRPIWMMWTDITDIRSEIMAIK
jgi:hypothetical protein